MSAPWRQDAEEVLGSVGPKDMPLSMMLRMEFMLSSQLRMMVLATRRVHSRSGDAVLGTLNLNITDCPEPRAPQQSEPGNHDMS